MHITIRKISKLVRNCTYRARHSIIISMDDNDVPGALCMNAMEVSIGLNRSQVHVLLF